MTDRDVRKSQSMMRRSDATMDRVLAKSRKMLKQKKTGSQLSATGTFTAATPSGADRGIPDYLSPKHSNEPELNLTSSLHPNSYG
jgi:hypothetical protein